MAYKTPVGTAQPNTKPKELSFWEKLGNFGLDVLGGAATAMTGGLAAPVVNPLVDAVKATPEMPQQQMPQQQMPQQQMPQQQMPQQQMPQRALDPNPRLLTPAVGLDPAIRDQWMDEYYATHPTYDNRVFQFEWGKPMNWNQSALTTGNPFTQRQSTPPGGMNPAQAMEEMKRRQALMAMANGNPPVISAPQTLNALGWNRGQ